MASNVGRGKGLSLRRLLDSAVRELPSSPSDMSAFPSPSEPDPRPSFVEIQAQAARLHNVYEEGLDEGRWRDLSDFAQSGVLEDQHASGEVWDIFWARASNPLAGESWCPPSFVRGPSGSYRLRRKLGAGAYGQVWEAQERDGLKRQCAIKFAEGVSTQEAALHGLGGRQHPNVCPLFAHPFRFGSRTAVVMQYLGGGTLRDRLNAGALELEQALKICEGVARALAHLHDYGACHLDVKPENILFDENGKHIDPDRPLLTDFGVSAAAGITGRRGTTAYMAPEVSSGEALSQAADVWSLGVVLYEAVTGALPFPLGPRRPALHATMLRIFLARDAIPHALRVLIASMLQHRAADRATMDRVKKELKPLRHALASLPLRPDRMSAGHVETLGALLSGSDLWPMESEFAQSRSEECLRSFRNYLRLRGSLDGGARRSPQSTRRDLDTAADKLSRYLDTALDKLSRYLDTAADNLSRLKQGHDDRQRLAQLLDALDAPLRVVMMLRLEGLSNTDIASMLGLNETNVRKMVAQALKYLRGKL